MLPDHLVSPRYWVIDKHQQHQEAAKKTANKLAGAVAAVSSHNITETEEQRAPAMNLANSALNSEATDGLSLQDYQEQILSGRCWAGQSCNALLEEQDRHIKERLFCAAKIETYSRVLRELTAEGLISEADLHQLIEETREQVACQGESLWLNLMTREKSLPMLYRFEDKTDY